MLGRRRLDCSRRASSSKRDRRCRVVVGGELAARLDAQQRRTAVDLNVAGDEHLGHRSADRGGDGDLHLHRLDDGNPVAGRHDVARGHVDADDEGGRRSAQDAGVVAGEAVGDAVDLDEVGGAVDRRHHREASPGDRQPAAGPTERLAPDGERAARRERRTNDCGPTRRTIDAVGGWRRGAARSRWPRPASSCGRPRLAQPRNRCGRWRAARSAASRAAATRATSAWRVGTWSPAAVSRSSQPVSTSPPRTSGRSSRSSRNDLFVVPPRTMTTICGQGPAEPGDRLVPIGPKAMTLAIIESYSDGITSPSATPVSTRIPGPTGSSSVSIVPGAGANPRCGSSALSRASMA